MWSFGKIGEYEYQVKAYKEGSDLYGIDGGRISKLYVKKAGQTVMNYDREWDSEPETSEAKQVLAELLREYN